MRYKVGYWVLACLFLLTGCGFHLRGETQFPPQLQHVYLKTAAPFSELTQYLKEYFKMSGVDVVSSPAEATTVLEILSENTDQQLIGVNNSQQTCQYNLTLRVTFQVTNPQGMVLSAPETMTQTRTLPISSGEILSGSNQASALFQQMRRAIVFDIMNRLSSFDMAQRLTHATKKP